MRTQEQSPMRLFHVDMTGDVSWENKNPRYRRIKLIIHVMRKVNIQKVSFAC